MKTERRTIEEIKVSGPEKKRFQTLDFLSNTGYTILRCGPRIRKDGWSWDMKQFEIIASRTKTDWKPSTL